MSVTPIPGVNLPPDFNYGALESALNSGALNQLPQTVRQHMQEAIAIHKRSVLDASMAGSDVTAELAHDTPQRMQEFKDVMALQRKENTESVFKMPLATGVHALHAMSGGILPDVPKSEISSWVPQNQVVYDEVLKPLTSVAAAFGQWRLVEGALSFASKAPPVGRVLEGFSSRVRNALGMGLATGIVESSREEVPTEPASKLDPAAMVAQNLHRRFGVPDRVGLGVGGAIFGSAVGPVLAGIMSGVNAGRALSIGLKLSPEEAVTLRTALIQSGVPVEENADRFKTAAALVKNLRKVVLNEKTAGVVSERLAREDYIIGELMATPPQSGIVRHADGSISVTGYRGTIAGRSPLAPGHGGALFISPSEDVAKFYSTNAANDLIKLTGGGGAVPTPVAGDVAQITAHFEKPFEMNTWMDKTLSGTNQAEKMADARARGYDGIIVHNRDAATGKEIYPAEYVALNAGAGKLTLPPQTEDESRFIAGVFRVNPGGMTVVRGVTSTDIARNVASRLGINLETNVIMKGSRTLSNGVKVPNFDVIVARPTIEYPDASEMGSLTNKLTKRLKGIATEASKSLSAPKTTESFILADGTPVRGGLRTVDLQRKLNLQKPIVNGVERPDLALKSAANYIRLELTGAREVTIELPNKISQQQFRSIGRSFDSVKMDTVIIRAADGTETTLTNPLGAQVQDFIATKVKPVKVSKTITGDMIRQIRNEDVFQGQAVVLPDGTAGEIMNVANAGRKGEFGPGGSGAKLYRVRDTLTGDIRLVHEGQMTILPTSLTSEFQPSRLFTQYLSQSEREALARMRFATTSGWANEITTASELKKFANTRGYTVESARAGKFTLSKVNDVGADRLQFANIKSAVEHIRNDISNLPTLDPPKVSDLLGENLNLGWIGGGGHTPNIGEQVQIPWEKIQASLENLGPRGTSLSERMFKPTSALFEAIDKRYGLGFRPMFENIQANQVASQNFTSLWLNGKGGTLPTGVRPLTKIFADAGKSARWELITDWREAVKDTPEAVAIWESMTAQEQRAATELGQWYNQAYEKFGVEAPFVENYMPHFRQLAESGNGTDIRTLWKLSGGDPTKPPKGMDWVSDHVREGLMDLYEKDARKVAMQYLRGAAHTKFLKTSLDEAAELTRLVAVKNPGLGSHMGHFLQAIRGTEFPEQRAALSETIQRVLDMLPGEKGAASSRAADQLVDLLNGAVYSSTQGFRFSLALRNASSGFSMVWPVFGGNGRFTEAVIRATSLAGRNEAVEARAISLTQGRRFDQPAVDQALREKIPAWLQELNEKGMQMYDSADQFTRSLAYHAAKMRAEDAIATFVRSAKGASPEALVGIRRRLLVDSRMFLHDPQITEEFLRRAALNPVEAAKFAGKQGADMTNFLYGRGMQAQWMRSVGGRLFGQFGTWSLWYVDYLRRLMGAGGANGFREEALGLLAKHVLVNAAIVYAGKEVLNVDMSRWATYGALFWSGGPGLTVMTGASTLMRGLGEVTSGNEDPQAQSRVTEGLQQIYHTLPTYVPMYFAGRDAINLTRSENGVEALAAVLGTRPTREFTFNQRMDRLLGHNREPFTASSHALEDMLNARAMGRPTVDVRGAGLALKIGSTDMGAPQGTSASSRTSIRGPASQMTPLPSGTPPGTVFRPQSESLKPADSTPIKEY